MGVGHAANGWSVVDLDRLADAVQAERANGRAVGGCG